MQILYLTSNLAWNGGTFFRALGFAQRLVAKGHDVTLLATSLENRQEVQEEVKEGVQIVTSPALPKGKLRSGWDPYEVWQRCRWLNGRSYDIVHGFESRPVVIYPALYSQKQSQARLVLDWCDWLGKGGFVEEHPPLTRLVLSPVETFYEEHFRARAVGTTVINQTLQQRAVKLGIDPDTIQWLPNTSEPEKIQLLDKCEARQAVNLDADAFYIGYLGHALADDALLMADAFAQFKQQVPNGRLLLIGDYRQRILSHFANREDVVSIDFVQGKALNHYLSSCDILWLPQKDTLTNRGRWPMKVSDYLACGRPVVSTAVGDLTMLFGDTNPVGLKAQDKAADFASKSYQLYEDAQLRERLGKNGRLWAETTFNGKNIIADLETFYQQVMNTPHLQK